MWSGCNSAALPCSWWEDWDVCEFICWSVTDREDDTSSVCPLSTEDDSYTVRAPSDQVYIVISLNVTSCMVLPRTAYVELVIFSVWILDI